MTGVFDYSQNPSANTSINGINIAERCAASDINDAIRQLMADIATMISNGSLMPTASVIAFAGPSAPSGYLLCDGSAVSRSQYSALFSAISTTYGGGDGSTTFNIPDYRGRVLVGAGQGTGLTNRVLGATGGAETVALTEAQNGPHSHTATFSGGTISGTLTNTSVTGSCSGSFTGALTSTALTGALNNNTVSVYLDTDAIVGALTNNAVSGSTSGTMSGSFSGTTGTESATHDHTTGYAVTPTGAGQNVMAPGSGAIATSTENASHTHAFSGSVTTSGSLSVSGSVNADVTGSLTNTHGTGSVPAAVSGSLTNGAVTGTMTGTISGSVGSAVTGTASGTVTIASDGSGAPHSNMQPFVAASFYIKT